MTGLPIAEVFHSQNVPTSVLSSLACSTALTTGLITEPVISAVNLSTKYPIGLSSKLPSEITATRIPHGISKISEPITSLSSLSKFQSNQTSFQTSGTSVNPLLLTLPKLESRPINVAFPPTQHLLNSTNSLPTQMVETAGLLQASTTLLGGVTTFNNDSLTIKITNVATESTNQGALTKS